MKTHTYIAPAICVLSVQASLPLAGSMTSNLSGTSFGGNASEQDGGVPTPEVKSSYVDWDNIWE